MKKLMSLILALVIIFSLFAGIDVNAANYTTMDTARTISLGTNYSGSIIDGDTVDYYKFSINASSTVSWSLNSNFDLAVEIYDSTGTSWYGSSFGVNSSGKVAVNNSTICFTKGTYYFRVGQRRYYEQFGSYSFIISAVSADESFPETGNGNNNTFDNANNISLDTTYKGQLAVNDTVDYYKFTINASSTVSWSLNSNFNIAVEIYDSNGTSWYGSGFGVNNSGKVAVNNSTICLTKGTYYFRVYQRRYYEQCGNYSFVFSAVSANESFPETGTDNTFENANKINLDTPYNGQIAVNDTVDYYKFIITTSSMLKWVLNSNFDIAMEIYDSNGTSWYGSGFGVNSSGQVAIDNDISLYLTKGTYYCKIYQRRYYEQCGNYLIRFSAVSANESFTETGTGINNTIDTASQIKLGNNYKGQLAVNDTVDYYEFIINESSTVSWSLNSNFDLAIEFYDSKGQSVNYSAYGKNSAGQVVVENESVELKPGTYYLKVLQRRYYEQYGNYSFCLCAHRFVSRTIIKPACEDVGEEEYTCSICGYSYKQSISATGHSFASNKEYCQNGCGTKNPNYVAPHTHSWDSGKITTAATCTSSGVRTYTCSCGETKTEAISAIGHSFVSNKEYCQNGCGTKNPDYVAKHIHHYQETVVYPDSTHLGYTEHTCSCGDYYFDAYTAPTGKLTLKHSARTANALKVTWNNVKTATGYQVQISTKDGKKWSTAATLKAGTTAYTFKSLAAGNAYKFRVRFYIKADDGNNYYSPWSATLTSPTLPSGTTLTKLTPAKKAFTAQWKKNAAVNGYQVQYSLKSNFSGAKTITVKSPKTLKAVAKKLYAGKYYYVRIRTYKTISKVNYFSAWSKTYKVKTK